MSDEPIPLNNSYFAGQFIERLTGLHTLFQKTSPDNPILQQDLKDINWLQPNPCAKLHRLIRFRLGLTLVAGILGILALLARDALTGGFVSSDIADFRELALRINEILLSIAAFSAFVSILVADFAYVMRNLNTFATERETGRWEMMRLTTMPPEAILDAKYAAAQLKSWHSLTTEYIPRLYLLIALVPYVVIEGANYLYQRGSAITFEAAFSACAMMVVLFFFFLEAGWRMRALTAIGLAISARSRDLLVNGVIGCFAIVGVHILEGIGLIIPMYLFSRSVNVYDKLLDNALALYYFPFALVIVIAGLINYAVLRIVGESARGYALRYAFRDI